MDNIYVKRKTNKQSKNVKHSESQWYTYKLKISTKQTIYFYNVNTTHNG